MDRFIPEDTMNAALGCVIGAFVGDALGSYIEARSSVSSSLLKKTLEMPGGGPYMLGAGQVTDDSELAMCMMRGLIEARGVLNLDIIADYYGRWIKDRPFDIGNTTRAAFQGLPKANPRMASIPINNSRRQNNKSQSNSAMMRCTPLCVWGYNLPDLHLVQAASLEASMTHANLTVQQSNACYALAISELLKSPGNRSSAYLRAKHYSDTCNNPELSSWFSEIESHQFVIEQRRIGWVKIGFVNAFIHLISNSSYIDAISHTLSLGGDTDTNSCIVGGLIGASEGLSSLPPDWVSKVTSYTFKRCKGRNRPSYLNQTEVIPQIRELLSLSPTSLSYIIDGVSTSYTI